MLLQILMTIYIGILYYNQVKDHQSMEGTADEIPIPSLEMFYQIAFAFLEPLFGTVIFFFVYFHWVFQFFMQHSTDVMQYLERKNRLTERQKTITRNLCEYTESLKSDTFITKLCGPFFNILAGIVCGLYLVGFIVAIFLVTHSSIDFWAIFTATFTFGCLINIYAFAVGFVYVVIFALICLFYLCEWLCERILEGDE